MSQNANQFSHGQPGGGDPSNVRARLRNLYHGAAQEQLTVSRNHADLFRQIQEPKHNLLEAIPGGAMLDANAQPSVAVAALGKAVDAVGRFTGALRPHFAYGDLSKEEYEHAHAMHIANHLSVFDLKK